jgi:putative drug exporter of the RND superfamily
MVRLARISIRRPKGTIAIWVVVAIVLSLIGLGVDKQLAPTNTVVAGTESSRAQHLANAKFGPSVLTLVMLEGPKAQLDKQGPKLVTALVKAPHTRALSAWDAGPASATLRPRPTAAVVVVSTDRSMKHVVKTDEPRIEKTVAAYVHTPVKSYVTGQAAIDRALKDSAVHDTRKAELWAIPILFVLLLLGLRAPLAAAGLTLLGAAIVLSTWGELAIIGKLTDLDPVGFAGASMVALALGIGFALLILDRFRQEELPPGRPAREPALAATRAVETTGRAILLAGTGILIALAIADATGPTTILTSLGTGVVVCSLLATGAAVVVVPAALALFGRQIVTVGAFGAPAFLVRGWDRLVGAGVFVTRRAVIVGAIATAVLLALAVPALSLKTGPPDPKQLPPNASARIAYERVSKVMGPGFPTPYTIVVASNKNPITSTQMLKQIEAFQAQIARDPQVYSVIGPGAIRGQTAQLGKFPGMLASSAALLKGGPQQLGQLENGLGQAGAGAAQLQSGLTTAAGGAGQLANGSGQAQAGAGQLHQGLGQAHSGSAQISSGLDQALAGATALRNGAAKALSGSGQLTSGLTQASGQVTSGLPALSALTSIAQATGTQAAALTDSARAAAASVQSALGALESLPPAAKGSEAYASAHSALASAASQSAAVASKAGGVAATAGGVAGGVQTVRSQVSELSAGLTVLRNGAASLSSGIALLRDGNAQLENGIAQLSNGGGQLTSGLAQLRDGAGALQTGLGQLTNGAGQLQVGLAGGVGPTGELVTGLGVMQAGVAKFRGQLPSASDIELLQQQSPGLFYSGYFVLAAVQGAPASARNQASFTINLTQGGNAGLISITPRYAASDPRTAALGQRLQHMSDQFARSAGAQVAVGGPAGELADYKSATNDRLPWVVAGLAVSLILFMMVALRSVLLPIVAGVFNLLTAAAAFGVLSLLFSGKNPPLGGPGWIDPMSIIAIFTAVFGISLVFLIVLLARMREEFLKTGDAHAGLMLGLSRTAAAATGAGLVVVAALIPFTLSEVSPVRQFGIGIAVAVLLDVLIVRPVLLPAAIEVLGPRSWWPTKVEQPAAAPKPKPKPRQPLRPRRPHLHRPHLRSPH